MDTPLLEQIGRILDEHCYGEVAQLELPPDDELEQDNRLMWLVGLCHLLNDDPESAAGFFSRCARLFPERASNHGFYGIALSQLGRDDEAERELKTALAKRSRPIYTAYLSTLYVEQQRFDEGEAMHVPHGRGARTR